MEGQVVITSPADLSNQIWPARPATRLTVGVIFNDAAQSENAIDHLEAKGFYDGCAELLTIDNSQDNRADCYTGIRHFLTRASGEWVLIIHQDVEVIDTYAHLISTLDALTAQAPFWAIAGNAGFSNPETEHVRISDPYREDYDSGDLPRRVVSLDENLLIVRKDAGIAPSFDLSGFHFYGTDLCLQAMMKGCSAWVINYHVRHLSRGKITPHFFAARKSFEKKYSRILGTRRLRTPSAQLLFGAWAPFRPVRNKVQGGMGKLWALAAAFKITRKQLR